MREVRVRVKDIRKGDMVSFWNNERYGKVICRPTRLSGSKIELTILPYDDDEEESRTQVFLDTTMLWMVIE